MITVGVSRHHNSSVCLLKDGEVIFHIEEERLSGQKYDSSPIKALLEVSKHTNNIDHIGIGGFVVPYVADNCSTSLDVNTLLLAKTLDVNRGFDINHFYKEHHLTHALGSYYNSGFDEALCFVFDGAGSQKDYQNYHTREKDSIYHIEKNNITELEKTEFYWNTPINKDNFLSVGFLFETISSHLGFDTFSAGKVMGLSSYGKNLLPFNEESIDWRKQVEDTNDNFCVKSDESFYEKTKNMKDFNISADLAFTIQKYTQEYVLQKILKHLEKSNVKNICLSGGYGLNCVANYYIKQNLPNDINLYVEPVSSDAGTSIAIAKHLYYKQTQIKNNLIQKSIYLGPKHNIPKNIGKKTSNKEVAELLTQGKIVALYQGRSEAGPRALGNRSILFDPRVKNGKDIINKVKGREFFRPFAGTILHEYMLDWFDMAGLDESPFMMYAVDVNKDKINKIPSIVHVDNTCRIQTLKREQNKNYYDLIKEFYNITNVPVLFNTSFNLAGKPLVETPESAIDVVKNSGIDYLYFAETQELYGS
jgi:carbamoyltransferase